MGEKVQDISSEFFRKMGVHIESISTTEEKPNIFFIRIYSDDSALLIGNRGVTLHDIQKILGTILSHHFHIKITIQLEINDYLVEKDSQLFSFINDKIKLCLSEKKEIKLPFFSPYERKKIHTYIADIHTENISTRSGGEGKERRIYICKKTKKMTIDMNGTEI